MIKLKTAWLATGLSGLAIVLVACGGGGPTGPQPLRYTFDEMYIARVPPAEQSEVVAAHSEYHKARLALATAENAWKEWNTQIEIADNERKAASLLESSAQTRKKAAEASGDMNRVNAATREIRGAELARKAADLKVDYYKAQHKVLAKHVRYAKDNMYYKKSQHELAKATIAKDKNIRPKGFVHVNYQKQTQQRSRDIQRAKLHEDQERRKADALKATWHKEQAAADKLRGVSPSNSGGTGTGTGTDDNTTTEPPPVDNSKQDNDKQDGDKKEEATDTKKEDT